MVGHKVTVIFDWDDTLLSVGDHMLHCQYKACVDSVNSSDVYSFVKDWNAPSKAQLARYIGHRFKDTIVPKIFTQYDANNLAHAQWVDDLYSSYRRYYRQSKRDLFRGIPAMLASLVDEGFSVAIATNKSRDLLLEELAASDLPVEFSMVVCGDDASITPYFKPHPRMIDAIQGATKQDYYIMVGDRDSDIIAAQSSEKAACTRTIGVQTNQKTFQVLPDRVVTSAADITPDLIRALTR